MEWAGEEPASSLNARPFTSGLRRGRGGLFDDARERPSCMPRGEAFSSSSSSSSSPEEGGCKGRGGAAEPACQLSFISTPPSPDQPPPAPTGKPDSQAPA